MESAVSTHTSLEALQAQVLGLSKDDRARLLERLVVSLDVDVKAEEEWERIADLRDDELDSGKAEGVPLEEAMSRLRARFPA